VGVPVKAKRKNDLAARIYRRLKGARGLDDDELWQHALFFAMSPNNDAASASRPPARRFP